MEILLAPIISEKTITGVESNKYVFKVNPRVNKHQVAEEIERIFKAKPLNVNMIIVKGEERLVRGRYKIHTGSWKKAIITLKKGDKIPGFEFKA